ncbi:MAG: protein translocase subunit SecF [Candidatus Sericytochromatia bacterium]|nr:protein translocase subunit SecF [Candidatus Sericytochromatia bacterium]
MTASHQTSHYDFVSKRKLWYALSLAIIIPCLAFFLMGGLKMGIDFTGGSLFELAFEKTPAVSDVRNKLSEIDKEKFSDAQISHMQDDTGQEVITVRSKAIDDREQVKIFDALKASFGDFEQVRVEVVGPTMGDELRSKAIWSTVIVMAMIVLYISFRFSFDYAVCGIIALVHDVMIVVGSFAMLGHFMGVEVDSLFITALLTVAGFSIHDTIVTFDRMRENMGDMGRGKTYEQVANDSINQTLARSINTSVTTMFPLLTLTIFGGVTIKFFSLAMLIGILAGVYSSIFVATPLLVTWRTLTRA